MTHSESGLRVRRLRWRALLAPWRRDEGQAAFELILIAPLFFLFILLLVDTGVLMYGYVSVSNAAREGARYGAVNCDGDCTAAEIQVRTAERSSGFLDPSDPVDLAKVTVSWPEGTGLGDPVTVSVSMNHQFLFFPVSFPVSSCADMRLEQADDTAPSGGSGC